MSGPKRSHYQVTEAAAERLRKERELEAARAARRRTEAVEKQRLERLKTCRDTMLTRHAEITGQLLATRGKMEARQFQILEADSKSLQNEIQSASSEQILDSATEKLTRFTKGVRAAVSKMAQQVAQTQKESLRASLDELNARLSKLPEQIARCVDTGEYQQVNDAMQPLAREITSGNLQSAESCIGAAEHCLSAFEQHYEEWMQEKERIARDVSACRMSIDMVAQDVCVAAWSPDVLASMRTDIEKAEASIARGDLLSATVVSNDLRGRIDDVVADANAKQLKADQRDYVAKSIATVLDEMGFVVATSFEYAGQPDTSIILSAVSASGQVVAVSVPVEGDVFYV